MKLFPSLNPLESLIPNIHWHPQINMCVSTFIWSFRSRIAFPPLVCQGQDRVAWTNTQIQLCELCTTDRAKQCCTGAETPGSNCASVEEKTWVWLQALGQTSAWPWGKFLCGPGHVSWPAGWDSPDNSLSHSPQHRGVAEHSSWGAWAVSRAESSAASPSPAPPAPDESLSWHCELLLKLPTRNQDWSSTSPIFPKASRCFRKQVWSLILCQVAAFTFGLQVPKAFGV